MFSPTQILQTVAFLDLLAAGLILPQLPNHARSLGCNHLLIGTMGALYAGFQLISGPIIGSWSQLKGSKTVLVITISLSGIAYVLLGITSPIVLFLALRAFLGFFKYTQMLTKSLAPVHETDKSKLVGVYGRLEIVSGMGMAIGPIIGGHIMETYPVHGFTLIASMAGTIYAINSGLIRKLPAKDEKGNNTTGTEAKRAIAHELANSVTNSLQQSLSHFYNLDWSLYWEVFLLRILMTLCVGVYFCNFALYLKMKHQATPQILGYITSLINIIIAFFPHFTRYVNNLYEDDKDFKVRTYHVFLTLTLALIGMALAPSIPVYVALVIPLAASTVVGRSVTLEVILNKAETSHKSSIIGVANNIRNISGVLAPLIAGVVGQYVGIFYIIYLCMALAAMGAHRSHKIIPEVIIKNISKSKSE